MHEPFHHAQENGVDREGLGAELGGIPKHVERATRS